MARGKLAQFAAVLAMGALMVAACGDDDDGADAADTTAGAGTTSAAATTVVGGAATTAPAGAATCDGTTEASDTGITEDSYKLGLVGSLTGAAAPLFAPTEDAVRARIELANAEGGVCGRTIELEVADDGSLPAQNLTASQSLTEQAKVFAVLDVSAFVFGGYRYLQEQNVPVIGGCFDGPEWYQQPNTNMVCVLGNSHESRPDYLGLATFMKDQGATKVAALGYGSSPSSTKAAQNFNDFSAPQAGLEPVYLNTSLAFGTVDVGSVVLDMKNRNVDGVSLPLIQNSNFAVVTGGAQAGIVWKAAVMATGYGQSLLDQPSAVETAESPGVFLTSGFRPVELANDGTRRMQDAFAKYASFEGVPDYAWYQGWMAADMAIEGLLAAGVNPTRATFLDALHGLEGWDANGLLAEPVDVSLEGFGKPQPASCGWYMRVVNGAFESAHGPEAVCGALVPESVPS